MIIKAYVIGRLTYRFSKVFKTPDKISKKYLLETFYVPELLNVHVDEFKKSTFFRRLFFKQWKINFREKKYVIFLNIFFYCQFILFYCSSIFFLFRSYQRSELQVHRLFILFCISKRIGSVHRSIVRSNVEFPKFPSKFESKFLSSFVPDMWTRASRSLTEWTR